ncbi:MAG: hypothetical protein J6V66_02115 [Clostridia bacterium]|nr:hypothetical protein [Clostridia bacterium]
MSVIVAIKDNGTVYMGADSQTSAGSSKVNRLNETAFKVVRLDNGTLVGFCGKIAARQTILAMKDVFTLDENGELTKSHIVKNIVAKLADKLVDIGDEQSGSLDVTILIAHKDNLFRISSDLTVIKLNEYGRAGSGLSFVDYALVGMKELSVRERILKALIESSKRTLSVSGPYVLIDTKALEYEVIDMKEENY